MSFLNIEDPRKRDALVTDYLALMARLKRENLNEKAQDLARNDDLKRMFEPVVQSTEKSTKAITKELLPLRDEMKTLNDRLLETMAETAARGDVSSGLNSLNVLEQYLHKYGQEGDKLDKYFGIQRVGEDRYMMGDKNVVIDEDSNILVDGMIYEATLGLWALIMLKSPEDNTYTSGDLRHYRDLVIHTDVVNHPRNVITGRSRPTTTYKWKHILTPLLKQQSSHDADDLDSMEDNNDDGDGIRFLPGDIKGLRTKLNYLLAEYRAGNRSSITRNEIVFILDELLRRKKISRGEYKDINLYLSC